MNAGRIVIAAIIGGIVMFCWGAASHMVLPLGQMGLDFIPRESEPALLPVLKQSVPKRGWYIFPWMDVNDQSESAGKKHEERTRQGPSGILIINPGGSEMKFPMRLAGEGASNVAAALLAAIVLASSPASWGKRTLLAGLMGVFAWLSIDFSYWNWYDFPGAMTVAALIDQTVGWLLAGAAIAAIVGRRRPQPM